MPLTSVRNPADLVNVALMRIGWKGGDVGDLYDGSEAANVALDVYGQVRDALLRSGDWDFAQRSVALVVTKSAPTGGYIPGFTTWDPTIYPPIPWLYQFAYPDDCIKVRSIKPVPLFLPNLDPRPDLFSIANDVATKQEVIVGNIQGGAIVYTARVTDLTQCSVDFVEAFADSLAESIAPGLTGPDATKLAMAENASAMPMARETQG